jgi:hypothetical protein
MFKAVKNCIRWGKIKEWEYFPFVLLGFAMLVMHIFMTGGLEDDAVFGKVKLDSTFADYLVNRYFTWSSRGIIELCVVLFLKLDFLIWKIFNTIIYTLIGVMLSKLLVKSNNKEMNYFIAGMMIIWPFSRMSSAGWVTTCTFYLYPLFCLIYCLLTIKKVSENKKISWHEYLFYAAAFLYASSMEQAAVIMAMFFALLVVLSYRHIVGISLIVSVAQVINAAICPGNQLRTLEETTKYLPMFAEWTLLDKLNIGFYTTTINFLTSFDTIFLMFILLLMFKCREYKLIIPLLIWVIYMPIRILLKSPFGNLISEYKITDVIKIGRVESIPSETLWLSLLLLIILLLILHSVIRAFDKSEAKAVLFILAAGFISRMLMGFSPTVYVSGYRTSLYMYFSIIICIIILVNKQLPQIMEKKIFIYLFAVVCAFSYISNFFSIFKQ